MAGNNSNIQLVDPDIGVRSLNGMGLSAQEQAALAGADVDPAATVQEFKQKDLAEQSALESYELARIQQENDEMRRRLEQTTGQLQEVRSGYDQITGQLTAMQQAQLQAAQQQNLNQQYALTQEELDQSADLLPVVDKLVGRTKAEMEAQFQSQLEATKQQAVEAATQPLKQELDSLRVQTETQAALNQKRFNADVTGHMQALGLGDSNTLANMPAFQSRYSQETYPGSGVMWGDELKAKIQSMDPSVITMLTDFRDNHSGIEATREDMQVPAGSKPSAPMTPSQSANLSKRDALTAKYRENMENANRGTYPPGCDTRQQYMQKQKQLQAEIDAIPTDPIN